MSLFIGRVYPYVGNNKITKWGIPHLLYIDFHAKDTNTPKMLLYTSTSFSCLTINVFTQIKSNQILFKVGNVHLKEKKN